MLTANGLHLGADLCDVTLAHDATVRCQLRVGHGGSHLNRTWRDRLVMTVRWDDRPGRPGARHGTDLSPVASR